MEYNRILIAIDDTECSRKALEHGKRFAVLNQAMIALVHVTEPISPTSYGVDPLMGQQSIIVPQSLQMQEENAKLLLDEIEQSLRGSVKEIYSFHRVGTPRQEILAVAVEWEADLIVMGTHGRTGFDHFISGSVSESVLRRASCPVLVVPGKC